MQDVVAALIRPLAQELPYVAGAAKKKKKRKEKGGERGKEGRKEGKKEGKKEGRKEGRKEFVLATLFESIR